MSKATKTAKAQSANRREAFVLNFKTDAHKSLFVYLFQTTSLKNDFAKLLDIQILKTTDESIHYKALCSNKDTVEKVFDTLSELLAKKHSLDASDIENTVNSVNPDEITLTTQFSAAAPANKGSHGGVFTPKTEAQAELANFIDNNTLVFAIGPAGTGKTHVAVMKAVEAFNKGEVDKIILARPAKASEDIGFLPGSEAEKLGPYMRPIYDELEKAFGNKKNFEAKVKDGKIEIGAIGFMRGRTFSNAFVIVDEAQNATIEHMNMIVTRIGHDAKMVITGDPTQIDLPENQSGLMYIVDVAKGIKGVATITFEGEDTVRSEIVKNLSAAIKAKRDEKPATSPKR